MLIVIFFTMTALYFRHNIKKYSEDYAQAYAKAKVIEIINECTTTVLEREDAYKGYDKFVNIEYDDQHNVKYIGVNMLLVNLLLCDLAQTCQTNINKLCENEYVKMPFGAMFGSILWGEYGKIINISINPIGNVICNFYNTFQNIGINNTRHELMASIIVDIEIIFPLYTDKQTLDFDFLLYQNLIIGEVPQVYLNAIGNLKSNNLDLLP